VSNGVTTLFAEETLMGNLKHYVIRGGIQGRERLRVLARVMHAGTEGVAQPA